MRFAPISGGPSTRLRLLTGYFALTGITGLVLMLYLLLQLVTTGSGELGAMPVVAWLALFVSLATAALFVVVAWLLHHRSWKAGLGAALLLGMSIPGAAAGRSGDLASLFVVLIGVAVLSSVWDELLPPSGPRPHS